MIFCLEDDDNIRELILYTLRGSGLDAEGAATPEEFFAYLSHTKPELIVLDIMLPRQDGLSILAELKKSPQNKDIPVILLTARNSEFDKVQGLDLGADDYITKPFGLMEMLSRVRAVLRRCAPKEAQNELRWENIVLWRAERKVFLGDEKIALSFKEFELLKFLLENPERVFSRDQLLNAVWGYEYNESRTVDVHIRTLRQKLGPAATAIQTIRSVGYKLGR